MPHPTNASCKNPDEKRIDLSDIYRCYFEYKKKETPAYQRELNALKRQHESSNNVGISQKIVNTVLHSIGFSSDAEKSKQTAAKQQYDELEKKYHLDEAKTHYKNQLCHLLDRALGLDLGKDKIDALDFLNEIDVSQLNFIGISVNGRPITREMLVARHLKGAEEAITSLYDFKYLPNNQRYTNLQNRVCSEMKKQGELFDRSTGTINLVPIEKAAEIGDTIAVKSRLSSGANPNGLSESYRPIFSAAAYGHLDTVKTLANHPDFNKKDLKKSIDLAKEKKQHHVIAYLENIYDINQPDRKGDTKLHHAVEEGNLKKVITLIEKKADINRQNDSQVTPLHMAASHSAYSSSLYHYDGEPSSSHINIARLLLDKKADANIACYERTPLHEAARAGSSTTVALLLPVTEKKDLLGNLYDETAHYPWYLDLMFNAIHKPEGIDILRMLKAHGADFNTPHRYDGELLLNRAISRIPAYNDGNTEACQEVFMKELEKIDFLLSNGINPNLRNRCRDTALHDLFRYKKLDYMRNGYLLLLDRFLQKGFDINSTDSRGNTLLHLAAEYNTLDAVHSLIERKADIHLRNNSGKTARQLAEEQKQAEMHTIFLDSSTNAVDANRLIPMNTR